MVLRTIRLNVKGSELKLRIGSRWEYGPRPQWREIAKVPVRRETDRLRPRGKIEQQLAGAEFNPRWTPLFESNRLLRSRPTGCRFRSIAVSRINAQR
jgi:hypothetical protein